MSNVSRRPPCGRLRQHSSVRWFRLEPLILSYQHAQRIRSVPRLARVLGLAILSTSFLLPAWGADDPRDAKLAELMRLQGMGKELDQARESAQRGARQRAQSTTDRLLAEHPQTSADKRAAIDAASRRFLSEVDKSFDEQDAVQAWGRFYSQGLTDQELDAIIAYYRSPVGRKDVQASKAALPQFEKYMDAKRLEGTNKATDDYAVALRAILNPPKQAQASAGVTAAGAGPSNPTGPTGSAVAQSNTPAAHSLGSNPTAPDGKVVADSVTYSCEAPAGAPASSRSSRPTGRSVLCVCVDEKGVLTQDPVIAESSGDPKVDSGAIKVARLDSGRYGPPTLNGTRQSGCFRYAINFGRQE
jgi:hypothetical protein